MADSDLHEWRLIDSDLTTVLRVLPAASGHMYYEINNPGSGEIKIPLDSDSAGDITSGMFVANYYRGAARGGFLVENVKRTEVDGGEEGGRWLSVSGRGPLATLEDVIVYDDGTEETTRTFTAQTKAAILNTLIGEAIGRGALNEFDFDFTATHDSNGVAWDDSEDYRINVGDSLLDVIRNFSSTGGFDFEMNLVGGLFVLSAYKNGIGTDKSNTVFFRAGADVQELSSDERGDEIKNVFRVKYKGGYTQVSDSTSITNRRRRETLLNAELAQSRQSAVTYAAAKLDESKDPKKSISIKVYDGLAPNIFLDYAIGDTVTYDVKGVETSYRVLGLQVDFQAENYASVILELNNIFYDNDLKRAGQLDWILSQWNTAKDQNLTEVRNWMSVGEPSAKVTGMLKYNGFLYVVGHFIDIRNNAGGVIIPAGHIAAYNMTTGAWMALGDGLPFGDYPTAIGEMGGNIYVGIYRPNTIESKLYKWDGSSWTTVGTFGGYFSTFQSMLGVGTTLYIGGNFTTVDALSPVSGLIKLVGSTFTEITKPAGTGAGNQCTDLVEYNGEVYGTFFPNGTAKYILQKTSGTTLSDVGLDDADFDDGIVGTCLVVSGSNLVFAINDGSTSGKIKSWDGVSASTTLLGTLSGYIYTYAENERMAAYLSDVYYAAEFDGVDGITTNNVAKLSGGIWFSLRGGVGDVAHGVAVNDSNGDVYVGGEFITVGNKPYDIESLGVYVTNFDSLLNHLQNDNQAFDMGGAIHGATASAITDADEMGFWENTANALRKITWANIKATLKTYFDTLYVALTGNQTIAGVKTFTSDPIIPDEAYDATTWNGSLEPPTKNAVRDKIETMGGGYTPPTTTAADDFQVGDGAGAWIKKTLAETVTILQTVMDALFISNTGWIAKSETWTRTGNHVFTLSGDFSADADYQPGIKIRYKDGGAYEYGTIYSCVHSAGTTTITLITNDDYAMAAATITDKYISKIEKPDGFPNMFNFTPPTIDGSGSIVITSIVTDYAKFKTIGRACFVESSFTVQITTGGSTDLRFSFPVLPIIGGVVATAAARDASSGSVGLGQGASSATLAIVRKSDASNWTVGTSRIFRWWGWYDW